MNNHEGKDPFSVFFLEKLHPEIERINRSRRSAVVRSLLSGGGVFIIFFVALLLFLMPYYQMLIEYEIPHLPLMILLPLTMGVICFGIVYIFSLRSVVRNFRGTLVGKFAEFIDPGLSHKPDSPVPVERLRQSLLFENLGVPSAIPDRLVGRRGNASCVITEVRIKESAGGMLEGVYFTSTFDRRLPALLVILTATCPINLEGMSDRLRAANISDADKLVSLEVPGYPLRLITRPHDQEAASKLLAAVFTPGLVTYCHQRKLDPYLSCIGDTLTVMLLGKIDPAEGEKRLAIFDTFNFERCREFCLDAAMGLNVSDELARNLALWEARVN